jgi:hypothetical protein
MAAGTHFNTDTKGNGSPVNQRALISADIDWLLAPDKGLVFLLGQ